MFYICFVKLESSVIRTNGELYLAIRASLAGKLRIQEDTKLFLEEKSEGFFVSRFPDELSRQMSIAEQVMREDHDLLRLLAES